LARRLGSGPDGLSSAEAAARLRRDWPNNPEATRRTRLPARLLRWFAEPLTAILLVAALATAVTGDRPGSVIILTIVAVSVGLDALQGSRAEAAAARLQASVALRAAALRDGRFCPIPVDEVVRGDVLRLSPGGLVPTDGVAEPPTPRGAAFSERTRRSPVQSDKGGGTSGDGWTPEEKGQGSPGDAGSGGHAGAAGEGKAKGRPTDDRAKMEEAAGQTEKASGEDTP